MSMRDLDVRLSAVNNDHAAVEVYHRVSGTTETLVRIHHHISSSEVLLLVFQELNVGNILTH